MISLVWKLLNCFLNIPWLARYFIPESQEELVKKLQFLSWKATKKI